MNPAEKMTAYLADKNTAQLILLYSQALGGRTAEHATVRGAIFREIEARLGVDVTDALVSRIHDEFLATVGS